MSAATACAAPGSVGGAGAVPGPKVVRVCGTRRWDCSGL